MQFVQDYTENFRMYRHECDFMGRATPGAILRGAQQIAIDHCSSFGMDDSLYLRTGTAFLLAKVALEFTCIPQQDQLLTFYTHPEAMRRATFKRLTWVRDEEGKDCAFLDSRWILVDTASKRILREPPQEMQYGWSTEVPGQLEQKLQKPAEREDAGIWRAEYSLCDTNGHLNNTRYADILCNALPPQLLAQHPVRRMQLHYHHEIPLGESFLLQRGQTGPDSWYFAGYREDSCCFEGAVQLF